MSDPILSEDFLLICDYGS